MTNKLNKMFNSFKNSLGEEECEIFLYGPIGEGWGENSCLEFIDKLDEASSRCKKIYLRINSEGGSVFTGQAIASAIKRCKSQTIALIDGLCASIATVISSACDKVIMPSNAIYMTHAPLCGTQGNAYDLREQAKLLDKIEETILNIYEDKCNGKISREQIRQLVVGENNDGQGTWMTAEEAYSYGFVDEVGHELSMVAKYDGPSNIIINGVTMDLSNFKNTKKVEDIINTEVQKQETVEIMAKEEKKSMLNIIDSITLAIKSNLGLVKDSKEELITEEVVAQVIEDSKEEAVSEEAELKVEETVEAVIETEIKSEVEVVEGDEQPEAKEIEVAEKPEDEQVDETEKEITEEAKVEIVEEIEQSETVEVEAEIVEEKLVEVEVEVAIEEVDAEVEVVEGVVAKVSLLDEITNLKNQLSILETDKVKASIKLAKSELSKVIETEYAGVPGKVEDKVELIYEIQNSAMSEKGREFVLSSLKSLSSQNLKDCLEIGHEQVVVIDEKSELKNKIKNAMEKHDLTEGQALLVVDGSRSVAKAKEASKIARKIKRK